MGGAKKQLYDLTTFSYLIKYLQRKYVLNPSLLTVLCNVFVWNGNKLDYALEGSGILDEACSGHVKSTSRFKERN